jgi:hypothetical protein
MPAKKKNRKKSASKKSATSKSGSKRKAAPKTRNNKRKPAPKTRKKTTGGKKPASKTAAKKAVAKTAARTPLKRARRGGRPAAAASRDREYSGEQSGDLQGLSTIESADSESVDELLEEGNAFEADVVKGVETAGDEEEKEVHSHEVPEDDVPGEYLDED